MTKTRPPRARRPTLATPKGEAQRALLDAELSLSELGQAANGEPPIFGTRMNAFLRSARAVPQILRKELRRNAQWVTEEEEKAIATDKRYAKFVEIRDDPAHHQIVEPQEKKSVEVVERIRLRGSVEFDLRDPVTGNIAARVQHTAPVDADSGTVESTRVTRTYFLKGSNEDAVSFCNHVLTTLRDLVNRAYQKFP